MPVPVPGWCPRDMLPQAIPPSRAKSDATITSVFTRGSTRPCVGVVYFQAVADSRLNGLDRGVAPYHLHARLKTQSTKTRNFPPAFHTSRSHGPAQAASKEFSHCPLGSQTAQPMGATDLRQERMACCAAHANQRPPLFHAFSTQVRWKERDMGKSMGMV